MSCWTKEQLENMLEDVVNELELDSKSIEKLSARGSAPSILVRTVLDAKNKEIQLLKSALKKFNTLIEIKLNIPGFENYIVTIPPEDLVKALILKPGDALFLIEEILKELKTSDNEIILMKIKHIRENVIK